ncbi:hypothetical protein [Turicimonas muris]|uniref:hypothetical protein n=1 Tax=Turicimonas muris TaxID=1796652 RepID=UPI00248CAFA0|nr:hypothetical protein [Turicimonas muris]
MDSIENKIEGQRLLEKKYSNNQLIPRIKKEIASMQLVEAITIVHNLDKSFVESFLVQLILHKRIHISSLIGVLRNKRDSAQEVCDEVIKCIAAGLATLDFNTQMIIVKFDISPEVKEELDRFQFPLPMIVRPRKVRSNRDIGYLENKGSIILRDNYTEEDVCLDSINRLNKIPLKLNMEVVRNIQNQRDHIDHPKVGETVEEWQDRRKQFDDYNKQAMFVMELMNGLSDEFYLTHSYDKRGRIYCRGYHINYQGNDYAKAVVEFAEKELVND